MRLSLKVCLAGTAVLAVCFAAGSVFGSARRPAGGSDVVFFSTQCSGKPPEISLSIGFSGTLTDARGGFGASRDTEPFDGDILAFCTARAAEVIDLARRHGCEAVALGEWSSGLFVGRSVRGVCSGSRRQVVAAVAALGADTLRTAPE